MVIHIEIGLNLNTQSINKWTVRIGWLGNNTTVPLISRQRVLDVIEHKMKSHLNAVYGQIAGKNGR